MKINKMIKKMILICRMTCSWISPVIACKIFYRVKFREKLDLKHPITFNQKLIWLNLYWKESLKSKCADKYQVREYVIDNGLGECLNELYFACDNTKEINWDKLPNEFVLKVNNTCGANIICANKTKLDEKSTLGKIDKWIKNRYYLETSELHYKSIPPKIICEKYLKTNQGFTPIDYKIYCFNGIPKVVMLCKDRYVEDVKYYFCDLDGKILPYDERSKKLISDGIEKLDLPKSIKEMYSISSKLSKPFPFVRVDFYDYNDKAIFGEMTFTPSGCLDNTLTEYAEKTMGEWIQLPKLESN